VHQIADLTSQARTERCHCHAAQKEDAHSDEDDLGSTRRML
jgi:hypothetical protein